jgi:hypothetical protein
LLRTSEARRLGGVEPAQTIVTHQQGLEGVIAKRKDSRYEAGKRSGSWAKYRLNRGQELVIGGYVPGAHGLDSDKDPRKVIKEHAGEA